MSDYRELIEAAWNGPEDVEYVIGAALDNAGLTMIEQGRKADRFENEFSGRYSDEMVAMTIESVRGLITSTEHAEASAWFAARGIVG